MEFPSIEEPGTSLGTTHTTLQIGSTLEANPMGPPAKAAPKRRGSRGAVSGYTKKRRVMGRPQNSGKAGTEAGAGSDDPILNVNIDDEYQVETILDKKMGQNGHYLYYIKWIGWPDAANTWEPAENLDGCDQELLDFETRWSERQNKEKEVEGMATTVVNNEPQLAKDSSASAPLAPPLNNNADDEEFMEYDILSKCPSDKIPKELIGVVEIGGTLTYLIEWEYQKENESLGSGVEGEEPDRRLINALPFKSMYPAMVIKYYEAHINFTNGTVPEPKARQHGDATASTVVP